MDSPPSRLPPGIEHDTDRTIAEARRLVGLVDRPNAMIKVPGTVAGIRALERLIAEGININVTLLFDVATYETSGGGVCHRSGATARGCGGPLTGIASVASFFVSRIDGAVDAMLPPDSPLRGTVAVANARVAYGRFRNIFSGPRWERLAAAGARVQRPLWASTSTKNRTYSDVLYVEALVAPNTVNTVPETTLAKFADHGRVEPRIVEDAIVPAGETLASVRDAGIDFAALTERLLAEGLAAFRDGFREPAALHRRFPRRGAGRPTASHGGPRGPCAPAGDAVDGPRARRGG